MCITKRRRHPFSCVCVCVNLTRSSSSHLIAITEAYVPYHAHIPAKHQIIKSSSFVTHSARHRVRTRNVRKQSRPIFHIFPFLYSDQNRLQSVTMTFVPWTHQIKRDQSINFWNLSHAYIEQKGFFFFMNNKRFQKPKYLVRRSKTRAELMKLINKKFIESQ